MHPGTYSSSQLSIEVSELHAGTNGRLEITCLSTIPASVGPGEQYADYKTFSVKGKHFIHLLLSNAFVKILMGFWKAFNQSFPLASSATCCMHFYLNNCSSSSLFECSFPLNKSTTKFSAFPRLMLKWMFNLLIKRNVIAQLSFRSRHRSGWAHNSATDKPRGARQQVQQDVLAEVPVRATHTMSPNHYARHGVSVSTVNQGCGWS